MLDENMIFLKKNVQPMSFNVRNTLHGLVLEISIQQLQRFFFLSKLFFFEKSKNHQKNNTFQVQGLLEKTRIWD